MAKSRLYDRNVCHMQRGDGAHVCAAASVGNSTCRDAVRAVRCLWVRCTVETGWSGDGHGACEDGWVACRDVVGTSGLASALPRPGSS
ncbi:hypothetical protein IG631_13946 [Alternaria alternata]|nr:hypothetical protein IG631_13946 [Alternaria alternata]